MADIFAPDYCSACNRDLRFCQCEDVPHPISAPVSQLAEDRVHPVMERSVVIIISGTSQLVWEFLQSLGLVSIEVFATLVVFIKNSVDHGLENEGTIPKYLKRT